MFIVVWSEFGSKIKHRSIELKIIQVLVVKSMSVDIKEIGIKLV